MEPEVRYKTTWFSSSQNLHFTGSCRSIWSCWLSWDCQQTWNSRDGPVTLVELNSVFFFIFKKCKYDFKTNSRYGRAIAQRDLFYNFLCRKNYIPSPTFYKLYFSPATNRIYTCKSKILRQLWQFCAHTSIFFPPELLLSYFRPPPQW